MQDHTITDETRSLNNYIKVAYVQQKEYFVIHRYFVITSSLPLLCVERHGIHVVGLSPCLNPSNASCSKLLLLEGFSVTLV